INGNGCFLYGKESIPMQLWKVVDLEGCLCYAFLPVNHISKKTEENQYNQKQIVEILKIGTDNMVNLEITDDNSVIYTDVSNDVYTINTENKKVLTVDELDSDEDQLDNKKETKVYTCDKCNISFPMMKMLKFHWDLMHKQDKDTVTFTCSFCTFESTNKSTFYSHINRKHSTNRVIKRRKKPQEYLCNFCGFESPNRRRLKEHLDRKHGSEYKYDCEHCGKKFKVKSDMRLHVRFKHMEDPVVCDICNKTCSNTNSLYVHKKWAHFKPKYKCEICNRRLVTQENLDQHIFLQHESRKSFTCEECGKSFNDNHRLKQHMMTHTGDRPYDCHICGKAFARRTAYRQHLLLHTGKRPYICDICGKAFAQKPGLICHRKCHPGEHPPLPVVHIDHILNDFMKKKPTADIFASEAVTNKTGAKTSTFTCKQEKKEDCEEKCNPFVCDVCLKYFKSKYLLKRHELTHTTEIMRGCETDVKENSTFTDEVPQKQAPLPCVTCDFRCNKRSTMIAHLAEKHDGIANNDRFAGDKREFTCVVCGLVFTRKESLRSHFIRKHTQHYAYSCEHCGKGFKVKGDLTTHTRLNHQESPVVCGVCGKTCRNSHSLYTHQKHAHYKAKYECPLCHRRLVTQQNLDQHLLTQHERKEKSVCEQCGKTFFENYDLRKHMRIHTGDKPYNCTVCGRAFARHSSLSQHLLLHTGERIYACDVCGKTFAQKAGLICHRKIHSGALMVTRIFAFLCFRVDPLNVESNIQKSFVGIECERTEREKSLTKCEERLSEINMNLMRQELNQQIITEKNRPIRKKKTYVECDHCRRKFLKKSNLAEHLKQHRHKCADCPKTFSLRRYLASHIEKNHRQQMYECSVCKYKSNNKGTLKNHYIRLHTSNYDYACDTCGKQFKIKKALNHHVKQNHSEAPPIVCDVCGHFSKNLHALKAHMKYRHYKPEFVCRICRRGMTTQENLEQHLMWHETREKVLCPTCGKRFRGRDLDSHMRVHTGVKPFPCPVCGKTFRRQTAQEQHVLIHTGKRPYICDICGQTFAQKPGLICHRKRHPGPLPPLPVVSIKNWSLLRNKIKSRDVHQCVKCRARFRHTRKLVEHLKNLHNIDRAFSCDECNKTFRSPMNIARHKLIHTGLKVFNCDLCEYSTNQKSNLECHRRRHAKDYSFKCETCGKGFYYRTEYIEHQNTHTNKNPYRCEHCCKHYKYKKNLLVHLGMHHTGKQTAVTVRNARTRHACKFCPERFVYKRLLDRHMKNQHGFTNVPVKHLCDLCGAELSSMRRLIVHKCSHTGEKIFECDMCDKRFASKENLNIHKRTHTGDKPHICPQCGRGFTQRTSLVFHLRYHSGQRPYQCPDCGKGFVSNTLLKRHHKMHEKITKWKTYDESDTFRSLYQWTNNHDLKMKNGDLLDLGQKFEDGEKICELCQAKFHFVTRLVAHLRIAHGIHRPFKCVTCGKNYPQQFMLNAHVKKSHTPKTVPCTQCNFMGVSVTDVEKHKRRRHRASEFTCEICSQDFVDKDALIAHASTHDFLQRCNACDSIFNDMYSLKEHNRLYHYDPASDEKFEESSENESEHKCDVCGKIYKYRSMLKQHKVRTHGVPSNCERRKYLCALCGKELKTAKGLEIHNRSHTGEKPYTCEVCGKCFACDTMLRTHNVTHTGERKYSCDQCGKAFTQRSTLVVHKRYHTGERPYICPRCNKGFITRTVLNTHMKSCR
ncbi:ZN208 protein, partial [Acromyrmex charruanus]